MISRDRGAVPLIVTHDVLVHEQLAAAILREVSARQGIRRHGLFELSEAVWGPTPTSEEDAAKFPAPKRVNVSVLGREPLGAW